MPLITTLVADYPNTQFFFFSYFQIIGKYVNSFGGKVRTRKRNKRERQKLSKPNKSRSKVEYTRQWKLSFL